MASRYGIETDNWRYADNSPVTSGRGRQANMINAGLAAYQAVRGFQGDQADSEAADAAKAAQQEQVQQGESPDKSPYYSPSEEDGKYYLNEAGQRGYNEDGSGPTNEQIMAGGVTATPTKYGLGANPTSFRDTAYTPAEKRTAGLQARADYWAGNNTVGAAGKAEMAQDRLAVDTDRREALLDRQRARKREDKADEVQQFTYDETKRKVGLVRAGDAAMAKIVPIGGYVSPDGTPAKKGDIGAAPQTTYTFLQANALARRAAGDYTGYAETSLKADKELNDATLRGINSANNVNDLNRGAYAQFNNGKDIAETKNSDGTTSFGHPGEPPMYTSNPKNVDRNPFQQFQDLLAAKVSNDPAALPKLHASIAKSQQEWARIEMSNATKKEIEGLRRDVRAASKKETRSETIDAVAISYADASSKAHDVEKDGPLTDVVKAKYLRDGYARQLRAERPATEYATGLSALPPATATAAFAARAEIEALRGDAGSSSDAKLAVARKEKEWESTYGVPYNSVGARPASAPGTPLGSGAPRAGEVNALSAVAQYLADERAKAARNANAAQAQEAAIAEEAARKRNAATGTVRSPGG